MVSVGVDIAFAEFAFADSVATVFLTFIVIVIFKFNNLFIYLYTSERSEISHFFSKN